MLGKLPVLGRPTILITVGQGPTALVVGAGGGCLDIFTLIYPFSPLSPSLWKTAQYRLKYCLKGPFNPKQLTNYTSFLQFYTESFPTPTPNNTTHTLIDDPTQPSFELGLDFMKINILTKIHELWIKGGGRVVRMSWVNFQCRGVLLIWIRVGQGPTALAVGAGGGCLDIFSLIYHFSFLSPSLWETARYRLTLFFNK